jgi:hypothetical protein
MPAKGKVVIIGGGTVFHVRPHLALSAPAYGNTAKWLEMLLRRLGWQTELALTKMAGGDSLETNADIQRYIQDKVLPDPNVKAVVMSAALCDYNGFVCYPFDVSAPVPVTDSGKNQPRLKTSEGRQMLWMEPADKVINQIRKTRKDIFLVGFKTTAGATSQEMFHAGLGLLKKNSCNLVFANDVQNYEQMIITPEQAVYGDNTRRDSALDKLAEMITARANLTFTRSTVVDGERVAWGSDLVPPALRKVVDHMIAKGAYKPFLGSTVGHFAVKVGDGQFLTSIRKSNFNDLSNTGLVRVETQGVDQVVAYGARPSVGGQSQRLVFGQHPDVDCIAHAHVALSPIAKDDIPIRPQWKFECGSHECGQNTSSGLKDFGGGIKAVMLDQHGPNIVFSRNADPDQVIRFIEANWDLDRQTSPL